jgi:hypothetical protein
MVDMIQTTKPPGVLVRGGQVTTIRVGLVQNRMTQSHRQPASRFEYQKKNDDSRQKDLPNSPCEQFPKPDHVSPFEKTGGLKK